MMRRRAIAGFVVAAVAATTFACASAGKSTDSAASQLEFGIEMARRGLWNEALFRFEQARRAQPADGKVLNNLAVAYEAVGRFDDALATYKEATRLAPGERGLKVNYSKFLEFYQNYRPKTPESSAAQPKGESPPTEGAR